MPVIVGKPPANMPPLVRHHVESGCGCALCNVTCEQIEANAGHGVASSRDDVTCRECLNVLGELAAQEEDFDPCEVE